MREFPNPKISKILLGVYQKLDAEGVAQKRGRKNLFTDAEKETIAFIKLVGSSGLTEEEIKTIKEQQAYQTKLTKQIAGLQEKSETSEAGFNRLKSKDDVVSFFENLEIVIDQVNVKIDINQMEVTELKPDEFFQFKDGRFMGQSVSGTFQVSNQMFKTIRIGTEAHYRVKTGFVGGVFSRFAEMRKTKEATKISEDFIPQNTKKAILERSLVRELFQTMELEVSKDDIKVLDEELKTFEFSRVVWERETTSLQKINLSFIYLKEEDAVKNLQLSAGGGRKEFNFGPELINRTDIMERIEKQLEK